MQIIAARGASEEEGMDTQDLFTLFAVVAVYVALTRWIFPYFGVGT